MACSTIAWYFSVESIYRLLDECIASITFSAAAAFQLSYHDMMYHHGSPLEGEAHDLHITSS